MLRARVRWTGVNTTDLQLELYVPSGISSLRMRSQLKNKTNLCIAIQIYQGKQKKEKSTKEKIKLEQVIERRIRTYTSQSRYRSY